VLTPTSESTENFELLLRKTESKGRQILLWHMQMLFQVRRG